MFAALCWPLQPLQPLQSGLLHRRMSATVQEYVSYCALLYAAVRYCSNCTRTLQATIVRPGLQRATSCILRSALANTINAEARRFVWFAGGLDFSIGCLRACLVWEGWQKGRRGVFSRAYGAGFIGWIAYLTCLLFVRVSLEWNNFQCLLVDASLITHFRARAAVITTTAMRMMVTCW
jgi:hypothetical protein